MTQEHDRWTMEQLLDACGDVANARTVRFWIKEGLVPPPSGGRGAHARYGTRHATRIAEIRRYQALGLSLANVALLLGAAPAAPAAPGDTAAPAAPATPAHGGAGLDEQAGEPGAVPFWARRPAPPMSAAAIPPGPSSPAGPSWPATIVELAPGIALHLDPPPDGAALDDAALAALVRAGAPLLATYAALRAAGATPAATDPTTPHPSAQEG